MIKINTTNKKATILLVGLIIAIAVVLFLIIVVLIIPSKDNQNNPTISNNDNFLESPLPPSNNNQDIQNNLSVTPVITLNNNLSNISKFTPEEVEKRVLEKNLAGESWCIINQSWNYDKISNSNEFIINAVRRYKEEVVCYAKKENNPIGYYFTKDNQKVYQISKNSLNITNITQIN